MEPPAGGEQDLQAFEHLIEGYADRTSVNAGSSIGFYINVSASTTYTITIFRMGWYQGLGARLMLTVPALAGTDTPAGTDEARVNGQVPYVVAGGSVPVVRPEVSTAGRGQRR